MAVIGNGEKKAIVWANADLTLSGSLFDDGSGVTTVYSFEGTTIKSFKAGRSAGLNSLSSLTQWQSYQISAGSSLTIPDSTLGFGNPPPSTGGGGTPPTSYNTTIVHPAPLTADVTLSASTGDELKFNSLSSGSSIACSMLLYVGGTAVAQVDFPAKYIGQFFSFKRASTNTTYTGTGNVFTAGSLTLS